MIRSAILLTISLLPGFLLAKYLYNKDREKEPMGLLIKLFCGGIIACLMVLVVSTVLEMLSISGGDTSTMSMTELVFEVFIGIAFVEEFCKWIIAANNNVVLKLFYKRIDVNYTVKVFHDDVMKSETGYTGKYGDVINSSTYVSVPEGMKLNTNKTTESITLGTSDVINIYYETTHVELSVSTNIETPRDPVEYGDQITYTLYQSVVIQIQYLYILQLVHLLEMLHLKEKIELIEV